MLKAGFSDLSLSTAEDWQIINKEFTHFKKSLADRIVRHMQLLEGDFGGFPIDRLSHCTQSATRAAKNGESDEYVVCALLHDIGDTLGTYNHPDVAATILEPFVTEENHWIVKHHGIFQGYHFFHHFGLDRNLRDRFRNTPYFEATERFVRLYDAPAFDTSYKSMPLDEFVPVIRKLFSNPRKSIYADIK